MSYSSRCWASLHLPVVGNMNELEIDFSVAQLIDFIMVYEGGKQMFKKDIVLSPLLLEKRIAFGTHKKTFKCVPTGDAISSDILF